MWSLVSMIIMTCLWQGRRVALYQHGKIFAIGKIMHISDQWVVVSDVLMAEGARKNRLAVSRNRIDSFWRYRDGDERHLVPLWTEPATPAVEDLLAEVVKEDVE